MNQEEFDRLTEQSKNTISAKVICDSVNPDGCRLTTMEWTYPRFIHAEIMTHRKLSRNSASSRAIPLTKMIERVQTNPVFPIHWGKNQKGMQAEEELPEREKLNAAWLWIGARDQAIAHATNLERHGIHKQIGNRLLEPWMWITVIVSATNFENLFALRCHKDAEPHFQNLAYKVRDAYDASKPIETPWGGWHLPFMNAFISEEPYGGFMDDRLIKEEDRPKVSAGRCARVSYLTHEGKRDPMEDIKLYERLAGSSPKHASPLEHPAKAVNPDRIPRYDWGNFDPGWLQLRKMLPGECINKRGE
jgi:thymidylate synthase ThyX